MAASDEHVNRQRQALALRYGQPSTAGGVSDGVSVQQLEHVMAMAQRHGVGTPIAPELASLLATVEPEEQMPPQLRRAVAALVVWLQQLEAEADSQDAPH